MTLEYFEASPLDAFDITLRDSDYQEALAWAPGVAPVAALAASIENATEAFTGCCGHAVVGIWGYRVTEREVHPWLMCSDLINQHSRDFLKGSRKAIRALVAQHPDKLICNYVYRDNLPAKRLLTYLGFVWVTAPGSGKFDFFYYPK